ncbi:MAG: rubrerythrin family protein [Phycisphaerae bacterium]|nr:rubrerythrin family protein [Phycisphaerae bacterium]
MELKGSKTEKNLLTAFAGESQARNKYTYFASQAKKEGYMQIAAIFEETAGQEKEHAKLEFKHLQGGDAEITAAFPAGVIGNTLENLKAAAAGEHYETNEMYPGFADVAQKEGFGAIATTFKCIAVAEKRHEDRYMALINNVSNNAVFKRGKRVRWVCRNCGFVHEGPEAPKLCAACMHPQAYFELDAQNY